MGLVSGNRLNRFWKKGVKPIKDAIGVLTALSTVDKETLVGAINELAEGKFDVAKLVASTNITEPGFAMDGKTASEAFAELYSNSDIVTGKLTRASAAAGGNITSNTLIKAGNICSIDFFISGINISANTPIAVIPDDFIPQSTRFLTCLATYQNVERPILFGINSNGNLVNAYGGGVITNAYITGTYIL